MLVYAEMKYFTNPN